MNGLWEFDVAAFRAIHIGLHRDWLDPVFWVITSTGLGGVQAVLIVLISLIANFRHDAQRMPWTAAFMASIRNQAFFVIPLLVTVAVSGIFFAQGVKRLIAERDRPSLLPWAHPQEAIYHNSFPSGHTSTSFAISFFLLFATWKTEKAWLGRYAMLWALLVGISRIYRGVHWPTDVLGGIFAGLISSTLVFVIFQQGKQAGREIAAENPATAQLFEGEDATEPGV